MDIPICRASSTERTTSVVRRISPVVTFTNSFTRARALRRVHSRRDDLHCIFGFGTSNLSTITSFKRNINRSALSRIVSEIGTSSVLAVICASNSANGPGKTVLSRQGFARVILGNCVVLSRVLCRPGHLVLFLPLTRYFTHCVRCITVNKRKIINCLPKTGRLLTSLHDFGPACLLKIPHIFRGICGTTSRGTKTNVHKEIFTGTFSRFIR